MTLDPALSDDQKTALAAACIAAIGAVLAAAVSGGLTLLGEHFKRKHEAQEAARQCNT